MSTTETNTPAENKALEAITQIANDLVAHCNALPAGGDFISHDQTLWDKHYAESWDSVEGDGKVFTGRDAVIGKYKWWMEAFTCHSTKTTGPFVGPTGFSVIFDMDVEANDGSMPRTQMKEIANYTVENGKVTREEFRFAPC